MSNQKYPAKVVSVIHDSAGDVYRVAINRGSDHGINVGQSFLIYSLGNEVFDPDTKELLGTLEIPRGIGVVEHVQNKMATIVSNKFEYEETEDLPIRGGLAYALMGHSPKKRVKKHLLPFDNVKVSTDLAKPV